MGTDALDAMLYAINAYGVYSSVAPLASCKEPTFETWHDFFEQLALHPIKFENVVINSCPNKRVAYLAAHARKKRTRKKNFNRAIRICERAGVL